MRIEFRKNATEPLAKILFGVAVLLGALTLLKVAAFLVTSQEAQGTTVRVMGSNDADANSPGEPVAQAKAIEQLKKENLFVSAPAKQHPVREVTGILGSEALIDGKWYKAGDSVADAKILSIEATKVRIAWDGQEKDFAPIGTDGSGGRSGRPGPRTGKTGSTKGPQMVVTGARRGSMREGSPLLSQEGREELRGRWRNMNPEERQKYREEMRERFGGRR